MKASAQEQIENLAAILRAYPNVSLKVGGYTDNTGNAGANLNLSHARAIATLNALVSQGIARDRLEAEGYGNEHPVASNDTDEGRRRNRRVDVRVTKK